MDRTVKRLLTALLEKCVENDLAFRTVPPFNKMINITDYQEGNVHEVSNGYLINQEYETPVETLNRMHDEVDEYIKLPTYEDDDNSPFDADHQTEEARARLTEQERAMKESGHSLKDFI